jgi:hypothetical protein
MGSVRGIAVVKRGPLDLGSVQYQVEVGGSGKVSVVKFERRLEAEDGDTLHLTLEDGRMLYCQVIDSSPYCAVLGEGPYFDRRSTNR